MAKKVRSARGEMVDFDLLKIKEQMASAPPPTDVRARQDFIEKRMRRRIKRVPPPAPKIKNTEVAVDPKMPATEDLDQEPQLIDAVAEPVVETPEEVVEETREIKPKRRQRARPKKEDNTEE